MITPMTKYSFILLNGEQNGLLEKIQEVGLVDITRSTKPLDGTSEALAGEIDLLVGLINGIRKAEVPENTQPYVYDGEGSEDLVRLASGTLMLFSEAQSKVSTLRKEIKDSKVWGNYDVSLIEKLAEAGVPLHFHSVSPKAFQEIWAQEYALSEIARDKEGIYFVVAGEDSLPGEIPAPKEDWKAKEAQLAEEED